MKRITVMTNEQWVDMYNEYVNTGSEEVYADLYEALKAIALPVGKSEYYRYISEEVFIHVPLEDFLNEAEYAIFLAIKAYKPEKGSLPALLKQAVKWAISDNIVRPNLAKSNRHNTFAQRIDFLATDNDESDRPVEETLIHNDRSEDVEKERTFVTKILEVINGFENSASEDDGMIVKTIFDLVIFKSESRSEIVNRSLKELFPEISAATLRKKKQRALARFTKFAEAQGFNSVNMSHL